MQTNDLLSPFGKACIVCGETSPNNDDGLYWVRGYIGISPIAVCGICYEGLVNMVRMMEGYEDDDGEE